MKKKNKELTIVTAYFDIGRGEYNSSYARGNNKYINYFKFWARIKNNVVIYTQKQFKEEIMEIRRSYGLEDKTKIIAVDDIYTLLPDIYERMCEIENDDFFIKYRYIKTCPENKAKYNYIMLLKNWCLMDAYENNYIDTDFVAWLDFGFNHGGVFYSDETDFDFLWESDFKEKIYVSALKKDDGKPLFSLIQSGEVYIQGAHYVMPKKMVGKFYETFINETWAALDMGFMDDDQTFLLMVYRKMKDDFEYEIDDWMMFLKNNGASHLKLSIKKNSSNDGNIFDKLLYRYRVGKRNKIYLKELKKIFLKDYLD